MSVRTTVDIPDELHRLLRDRAQRSGRSMRALIVHALETTYGATRKGRPVTGPMVTGRIRRGPAFPVDENPHDLVFS